MSSPEPPRYRSLVYFLVVLGVQGLMSWDGGATQQASNALGKKKWSATEIGILVGIDRFPGVVLTAPIWGYVLSRCSAKPFLLLAIFAKAGSSMLFGLVDPSLKIIMIACRFSMGAWEALFAVWALGWIGFHGEGNQKVEWLNFLGISAGIGSGAGGLVTGFLGEKFMYAYIGQSCVLFLIFLVVLFLPGREVVIRRQHSAATTARRQSAERGGPPSLKHEHLSMLARQSFESHVVASLIEAHMAQQEELGLEDAPPSFTADRMSSMQMASQPYWTQVKTLLRRLPTSALWINTCVAFSFCAFIQSGFNCLWQNTAVNGWDFKAEQATLTITVVMFAGGFPGIKYGESMIGGRRERGVTESQKRYFCLEALKEWAWKASICGTIACFALAIKVQNLVHLNIPQPAWGVILVMLLFTVFALNFAVSGMQGFLQNENRDAAPPSLASTSNGVQVLAQNLFGFGMGAFLPSVITDVFGEYLLYMWPEMGNACDGEDSKCAVKSAQYIFGMCTVVLAPWILYLFICRAIRSLPPPSEPRASNGSVPFGTNVGPGSTDT
eukprot:TRINITY_DN3390_c0_g1_i3.p1 TRINITY_DN3390_c0_g1~~TRINITY_DN3390_c0_g1_i3.p1  ORF type:complete len:554 (-),score=75.03 TRINITY_DN3390_c0_g1_i3:439-2100(-)